MSTIEDRILTGARASTAVRCMAAAEYQGLQIEGDPTRMDWLKNAGYLDRGLDLGEAWAIQQEKLLAAEGKTGIREHAAPWGPAEYGWETHADLAIMDDKVVWEVQVAAGGAVREEKLLQAAFGADVRGEDWKAALAIIDPGDVDARDVMKVHLIPIEMDGPDGLRVKVRDIQARVIAAVQAGAVNPADKVASKPTHGECFSCAFKEKCWEGYVPPEPVEMVGLEDKFEALRITDGDVEATERQLKTIKERQKLQRDGVLEFLEIGIPITSGDTTVTVREVRGRTTFSVTDYTKSGHQLPDQLLPFVKHGKGHLRWDVTKVTP